MFLVLAPLYNFVPGLRIVDLVHVPLRAPLSSPTTIDQQGIQSPLFFRKSAINNLDYSKRTTTVFNGIDKYLMAFHK